LAGKVHAPSGGSGILPVCAKALGPTRRVKNTKSAEISAIASFFETVRFISSAKSEGVGKTVEIPIITAGKRLS
jgi:hypothetical protein